MKDSNVAMSYCVVLAYSQLMAVSKETLEALIRSTYYTFTLLLGGRQSPVLGELGGGPACGIGLEIFSQALSSPGLMPGLYRVC